MHANASAECQKCGAQRGNYQYCINCGQDSNVEVVADADQSLSRVSATPSANGHNVEDDAFSSPEAKSLAEQLAALVVSQNKGNAAGSPAPSAAQIAVAERPDATVPPTFEPPPAAAGARESERRRGRVTLVAVAALLVLGLASAGLVRLLGPDNDVSGTNTGTLVSADDQIGTGQEAGSTDRVVCWDGQTAFSLRGCGSPAGLRGLSWVFPSIQPEECEAIGTVGRPQAWSCPVTLEGRDATIVYGQLFSVDDGIDHYNVVYENGVGFRKDLASRYVWKASKRNVRDVWQFSSMYVTEPWSVHVESATRKGAKLAFKSVEFRATDEMQGVVAGD